MRFGSNGLGLGLIVSAALIIFPVLGPAKAASGEETSSEVAEKPAIEEEAGTAQIEGVKVEEAVAETAEAGKEEVKEEETRPSFPVEATVTADSVNIRKGPGTGFRVVTKVYKGTKLEVVSSRDDWYEVKLPAMPNAWMIGKYIEKQPDGTGIVTGSGVHIRAGNSTDYDILGQLDKGDKVRILDESEGWYKIEPVITTGFIFGRYLEFGGKAPVIAEEPTKAPAVSAQPELEAKFQKAEAAFSEELKKPLEEWDFGTIAKTYEEVAEKSSDPMRRVVARRRLQSIEAARLAQSIAGRRKAAEEAFQKRIKELEEKYAKEVAQIEKRLTPGRYLSRGVIEPLAIDFAKPATHKLLKDGKIDYLVYSSVYNLDDYVGKNVGILGEIVGAEAGVSIINITKMDVLEETK